MFGSVTSASPTSAPPGSIWSTPGGSPASSNTRTMLTPPVTAVRGSGLSTTELPSASAGATERMPRMSGTLNGAMTPTTPTGTRRAIESRGSSLGSSSPYGVPGRADRGVALLAGDVQGESGHAADGTDLADVPFRELLGVLLPEIAGTTQHGGAFGVRPRGPLTLRLRSTCGGLLDVAGRRHALSAQLCAGGRFDDRSVAASAVDPRAVDVDLARPGIELEHHLSRHPSGVCAWRTYVSCANICRDSSPRQPFVAAHCSPKV